MPVTVKGQVTIPKPIRDRLGLTPGAEVDFEVDSQGRVVLHKSSPEEAAPPGQDRFARFRGTATAMKGMSTDDIMRLLRGDDD